MCEFLGGLLERLHRVVSQCASIDRNIGVDRYSYYFSVVTCIQGKKVYRIIVVRMMDLRKMVLTQLEQGSVDVWTLHKKLNVDFVELANELNILREAGYITKTDDSYHLTERGRQHLEVEKKSGS